MNKSLKHLAILSGCLLTPLIICRAYFSYMSKKSGPFSYDRLYSWRFGKIHYRVNGRGQPLLLVHGIYPGADMHEWHEADSRIYQSFKVYEIDLLGFGHSEKPSISYSAYLYIRLINNFISDIIKEPALVAASDYSAAYTVLGYIFDPTLYKKIILISPAGITEGQTLPSFRHLICKWMLNTPLIGDLSYIGLTRRGTAKAIFEKLHNRHTIASFAPSVIPMSAFVGGINSMLPISALLCKYLNVNIIDKLNRIKIPMLILSRESFGFRVMPASLKSFLEINAI